MLLSNLLILLMIKRIPIKKSCLFMRFFCKILFIILLIAEGYPQIKADNRTHFFSLCSFGGFNSEADAI